MSKAEATGCFKPPATWDTLCYEEVDDDYDYQMLGASKDWQYFYWINCADTEGITKGDTIAVRIISDSIEIAGSGDVVPADIIIDIIKIR